MSGATGGMVAGGGLSLNYITSRKNRKQVAAQLEAQKKAVEAKNKAVLLETSRQIGEMNRQRSIASLQTTEALAHYKRQAGSQTGSMRAAIATADNIGTASLYMQADIERQRAEAEAMSEFNLETTQENINSQAQSMINNSLSSYTGFEFMESTWNQVANAEQQQFVDTMMQAATQGMSGSKPIEQGSAGGMFSQSAAPIVDGTKQTFSTSSFTAPRNYSGSFGFSSGTGKSGGWIK